MAVTGLVLGWVLAAGSLLAGLTPIEDPARVVDLHATLSLGWLVGWIMGPVAFRGGGHGLRPECFALLPIRPRRLAVGLLGATFTGRSVAITLVAFAALVVSATRLGAVEALVAVPAVLLQLVVVVLASKVCVAALTVLLTSRRGQDLGGLVMALTIALASGGWSVIAVMAGQIADGPPPAVATTLRILLTGWAPVATVAAHLGDWWLAVGALVGLLALAGVLLIAWAALLQRTMCRPEGRAPRTARAVAGAASVPEHTRRLLAASPTAATARKELRSWRRDPSKNMGLMLAVMLSGLHIALPAVVFRGAAAEDGIETLLALPWVGVVAVAFASMAAVNLYGNDGTALWLLRMVPGAESADVRGRQAAWLMVAGGALVTLTVGLTVAGRQWWAWPWILATLPAMLGATAGVMMVVSVAKPIPRKDPSLRSGPFDTGDDPDASGDEVGQAWLMALAAVTAALPGSVLVYLGTQRLQPGLQFAGVAASVGIGLSLYWWGGHEAGARLARRGGELMDLLGGRAERGAGDTEVEPPSRARKAATDLLWIAAVIAVFPQGLVPLAMTMFDVDPEVRVWFLARYVPEAWQVATALEFVAVGMLAGWSAVRISRRARTQVDDNTDERDRS